MPSAAETFSSTRRRESETPDRTFRPCPGTRTRPTRRRPLRFLPSSLPGSCCRSSYSSVSDHDHFGTDVVVDRSSRQDELAVEVDAVVDSMGVDPPHRGEVLVESAESHLVSVDLGLRSVERRSEERRVGTEWREESAAARGSR